MAQSVRRNRTFSGVRASGSTWTEVDAEDSLRLVAAPAEGHRIGARFPGVRSPASLAGIPAAAVPRIQIPTSEMRAAAGQATGREPDMEAAKEPGEAADPYDLERFAQAQKEIYGQALLEITNGRKQSHWMWYVFPQFDGLGISPTSRTYSIKSLAEAEAYLAHPILGPRLVECAEAALGIVGRSAE